MMINVNESVCFYFLFKFRREVLTPSPLLSLIRFFIKGDAKFNQALQISIDYLVSAAMIVFLLIGVLFGTIFLTIQVCVLTTIARDKHKQIVQFRFDMKVCT